METSSTALFRETALRSIYELGYGEADKVSPSVVASRSIYRERLMSILSTCLGDSGDAKVFDDLLLRKGVSFEGVEMDTEVRAELNRALSALKKARKSATKAAKSVTLEPKESLQATLALLFGLVIFQLLNGEPDAAAALEDLHLCQESLSAYDGVDSQACQVLVELLLSFASKPSALLRKVTQTVFKQFASEITVEGLQLMTDVLSTTENWRGQQELFEEAPETMEDGDESDDASDVEIVDGHVVNGEDDDDDESSSDTETSDAGDEDDQEALDAALAQALGTKTRADGEDASDSDADMTDSEMLELDNKLVEIFKQRKNHDSGKKNTDDRKQAKVHVINFKRRVLDLLEIYIKQQAGTETSFSLLTPLLRLINSSQDKSLVSRCQELISTFAKSAKNPKELAFSGRPFQHPDPATFPRTGLRLLKAVHEEAALATTNASAKAYSSTSSLVASAIYRIDEDPTSALQAIAKIYHKTQLRWLAGDTAIKPGFFIDWVNWCQSHVQSSGTSETSRLDASKAATK